MAFYTWVARTLASRLFGINLTLTRYLGLEDPYYETVYIPRPNDPEGVPDSKRVRRPVPAGITKRDEDTLASIKRWAYRMDMWFLVLGLKAGVGSLVGLVPVVGPVVNCACLLYIYYLSTRLEGGLPWFLHVQVVFNIVLDFALGSIPVVGDLVRFGFKCNSRNFLMVNKHLVIAGQRRMGVRDVSGFEEFKDINGVEMETVREGVVEGLTKAREGVDRARGMLGRGGASS